VCVCVCVDCAFLFKTVCLSQQFNVLHVRTYLCVLVVCVFMCDCERERMLHLLQKLAAVSSYVGQGVP
jgi:hypothetical protein